MLLSADSESGILEIRLLFSYTIEESRYGLIADALLHSRIINLFFYSSFSNSASSFADSSERKEKGSLARITLESFAIARARDAF